LDLGAAVTITRNDIDYVVTEYGIAPIRGRAVRDRVDNLLMICHPKFHDQLKQEAVDLGIYS
jgi:acyl-CoA hydrolase